MPHNVFTDIFYSLFPSGKTYLNYKEGNSPIILSAPHGGNIIPVNAPLRTQGKIYRDTYTRRLMQRILELSDKKPFFIYADIHRKVVDLNREINEATQGHELALRIWNEWNKVLPSYLNVVRNTYGKGLYIDIHSHNKHNKFQFGYGLSVIDYRKVMSNLITKKHSTLYALKDLNKTEFELLFGTDSILSTMEFAGYEIFLPQDDADYLNGGYNIIKNHGRGIGALQIECPVSVLATDLDKVARTLVNAIDNFSERFVENG